MIGRILEDIHRRAECGDVVYTTDDSLTVTLDADGAIAVLATNEEQLQLRVSERGRVGWAGGFAADQAQLIEAAFRSAGATDPRRIFLPLPSPLAPVVTEVPSAAALDTRELAELVRAAAARAAGPGRQVEVSATRSSGAVEIGNTRGVSARYGTSLVVLDVRVWRAEGLGPPFGAFIAQCGPINAEQVAALGEELTSLARTRSIERDVPLATVPVLFEPRAVRGLLRPLLVGLLEQPDSLPDLRLDARLSLVDDPLANGRPGSRPIDDDGVPSQRTVLLSRGRVVATPVDVAGGTEQGRPATGHAWRRGFAPPRLGFTNLILEPGNADRARLLAEIPRGLRVHQFRMGPAPNPMTGAFRVEVPWADWVENGEVVGRLSDLVIAGNVFELLGRVLAVGADLTWLGGAALPPLVVDGVVVFRR